jgi:hypothetical protein
MYEQVNLRKFICSLHLQCLENPVYTCDHNLSGKRLMWAYKVDNAEKNFVAERLLKCECIGEPYKEQNYNESRWYIARKR